MLSSGTHLVPSSACLRCQLRSILQRSRCLQSEHHRLRPTCRAFSSQQYRLDDTAPGGSKHRKDYYYRHVGPQSRIIGKKGRKQRQVTEQLSIDSLGQKSEVIVLRDYEEQESAKWGEEQHQIKDESGAEATRSKKLSPEEIQAAIAESDIPADDKEVAASITELRPQESVLDEAAFQHLVKELHGRYTKRQLSRYLKASLALRRNLSITSTPEDRRKASQKRTDVGVSWQSGFKPLEERLDRDATAPPVKNQSAKEIAAENIIRQSWEVSIASEEQEFGQMEIQVRPLQLKYLFDTINDIPRYASFVKSSLLLESATIESYEPANIVRITARRHNAEAIAQLIRDGLRSVAQFSISVADLRPLMDKKRRNTSPTEALQDQDLMWAAQVTGSFVVRRESDLITIYNHRQSAAAHARRLLVSLVLEKYEPAGKLVTSKAEADLKRNAKDEDKFALFPIFPSESSIPHSYRTASLGRLAKAQNPKEMIKPMETIPAFTTGSDVDEAMQRMVNAVETTRSPSPVQEACPAKAPPSSPSTSYWSSSGPVPGAWKANLGLSLCGRSSASNAGQLLLPDRTMAASLNDTPAASTTNLFLHQTPALETLFSYMFPKSPKDGRAPLDFSVHSSRVVARFIPSPLTAKGPNTTQTRAPRSLTHMPTMELELLRSWSRKAGHSVKLIGMRAVLQSHAIDLPLPNKSVDLRFSRDIAVPTDLARVNQDKDIAAVVRQLAAAAKPRGVLNNTPELKFKLPLWMARHPDDKSMAKKKTTPDGEVEVPYIFERFEASQYIDFVPDEVLMQDDLDDSGRHEVVIQILGGMIEGEYIRYEEMDAGLLHGRYTAISLHMDKERAASTNDVPETETEQEKETPSTDQPGENVPPEQLVYSALQVAEFITRAAKEEVTKYTPSQQTSLTGVSETPTRKRAWDGGRPKSIVKGEAET